MSFISQSLKDRANFVKQLADELNAEYYCGLDENIKKKYDIAFSRFKKEEKESNVIVGNFEGYEYFFEEFYHERENRRDFSRWISYYRLRLKGKFPNFTLKTKRNIIQDYILSLFTTFALFLLPALLIYINLSNSNPSKAFQIFFIFLFLGTWLMFMFLGVVSFIDFYFQQKKYKTGNQMFDKKYIIQGNPKLDAIKTIFSDEVCSKIANYPFEFNFIVKNNILVYDRSNKCLKYLNLEVCKKVLNDSVSIAKILEEKSDSLN